MSNHCNDCSDVIHKRIYFDKVNISFLFGLNVMLLLFVFFMSFTTPEGMSKLLIIGLLLYLMRNILSAVTRCRMKMDDAKKTKPWNIIAERLMFSILITLSICKINAPVWIKFISVLLTVCIGVFEITSHQQYTSDIIITSVLTYVAVKAFGVIVE